MRLISTAIEPMFKLSNVSLNVQIPFLAPVLFCQAVSSSPHPRKEEGLQPTEERDDLEDSASYKTRKHTAALLKVLPKLVIKCGGPVQIIFVHSGPQVGIQSSTHLL